MEFINKIDICNNDHLFLSEDKKYIYCMGIIDTLTAFTF